MQAPKPKYISRLDFLLNSTPQEYDAQWAKEELEDEERPVDLYDVVTSGWFDWEAYEESKPHHSDDEDLEEWIEAEYK